MPTNNKEEKIKIRTNMGGNTDDNFFKMYVRVLCKKFEPQTKHITKRIL